MTLPGLACVESGQNSNPETIKMLSATAKNNFEKNMRKHAEQSATPNAPKRGKREKKKDWCLRAARGNGLM